MQTAASSITQHQIMSEEDYKAERAKIEAQTVRVSKSGVRDQLLAQLFYKSGWTQEALARAEGKNRAYICRRLTFGRFLDFIPNWNNSEIIPFCVPADLSERKFSGFWQKTAGGNDRIRVIECMKLIAAETELHLKPKTTTVPSDASKTILDKFGDGAWHEAATIAHHLGANETDLRKHLSRMKSQNIGKCIYKTKPSAKKGMRYRIIRGEGKALPVKAVLKEIEPLLNRLDELGRSHAAEYNRDEVKGIAFQIKKMLEKMAQ